MGEGINQNEEPPKWDPNTRLEEGLEPFARLRELLDEAEAVFMKWGRIPTKPYLITLLKYLGGSEFSHGEWEDKLTKEEFAVLDRRYKVLSNAVGIMTRDGTVRHNLNPGIHFNPDEPLKYIPEAGIKSGE